MYEGICYQCKQVILKEDPYSILCNKCFAKRVALLVKQLELETKELYYV